MSRNENSSTIPRWRDSEDYVLDSVARDIVQKGYSIIMKNTPAHALVQARGYRVKDITGGKFVKVTSGERA